MASATDTPASRADESTAEVTTIVSPEVKVAAAQAVLSEGDVEVTEVLRDRRGETLALVQRLLASAGIKGTFSLSKTEDVEQMVEVELADANESLEELSDIERACLEAMREDFDHGIVLIDENANKDTYKAALEKDKAAGQSWETVQGRLLANEASFLKEAVELSKRTGDQEGKGARLVGVYENGELAIRQRSQEIVNAIVTKEGQLRLAFHPEAKLEEGEQWAKAVEIVRAVKAAGYHVPADAPDYNKEGLVAASEAVVTGADYVASPNRDEWRDAMLECPDNVSDDSGVRVVRFSPCNGDADVRCDDADARDGDRGAVLWLRG